MSTRNYSSTAAQTTLASGVDASNTTLSVSATTGFPSVPFILAVDAGAAAQELVLVTNVAGLNLTVTRGYDSTVAVSHDVGAVVSHSHGAIDFREANSHVNASSGVHGVSGPLVGTTDPQTLTNKTLTAPAATGSLASFGGAYTSWTPTFAGDNGAAVTCTVAHARRQQVGKRVDFHLQFTITSIGTATGNLNVTNMIAAFAEQVVPGRDNSAGPMLQGHIIGTALNIKRYDNASMLVAGKTLTISGSYEAA